MIKCPNCEKSHYVQHYSTSTAVGWIQEYENGIPINSNPNVATTYCTCCACGHDFFYTEQYGKVQEIVDQGKKPEIPVVEMPINSPSSGEALTLSQEQVMFVPSNKIEVEMATSKDIEEINKKIERLTKMVESLWELNTHGSLDELS